MSKTVFLVGTTLVTSLAALATALLAYRESLVNNEIAADHHAWLHEIEDELNVHAGVGHHVNHINEKLTELETALAAGKEVPVHPEAEAIPVPVKPTPKPRAPRKPVAPKPTPPVVEKATEAVKNTKRTVAKAADKVADKVEDAVDNVVDTVTDATKK